MGREPAQPPPQRNPTPHGELAGKVAVVTGASAGIGRAIALELAAAGADVVVHYRRSREAADRTADEIRGRGVRAQVITADIADPEGRARLVEQAYGALGRADVWVNNAGADILTGDGKSLSFTEKLRLLWSVDVEGTIALSREVGGLMRDTGGVILNMGWDQAQTGFAGDSGELFAAVKGAVMCFTRSLALSLAPHVRVNCLAPGWIRTAWGENAPESWQTRAVSETPLGRWGTPADVAKAARFLAGPGGEFITGQTIAVNGGAVR